jgi:hypothetical protein
MNENNGNSIEVGYHQWREELRQRIADLDAGLGIEINSDEELGAFLKQIEDEVRQEMGV